MALISVDHAGRHNPVRRKSPQATVGELAGHTLHKPARGGSLAREGPHHGRGLVHLTLLLLLILKRNQGFFLHNVTHFFSHFSYWIKIKDFSYIILLIFLSHFLHIRSSTASKKNKITLFLQLWVILNIIYHKNMLKKFTAIRIPITFYTIILSKYYVTSL